VANGGERVSFDRMVNMQGQVVFDEACDHARQRTARETRESEPFTATIDCPHCGHMAVHWLAEPRLRPDVETPAEKGMRMINESIWSMGIYFDSPPPPRRWYDTDGTVVARVCVACGYRWGQR
jgi:DNA-directed RNA polymerase subunit M/transcription elongation factor TFIIS